MKLKKIFAREYSVQYTEVSVRSLHTEAKKLIPKLVTTQTYVPENGNEACAADPGEWQAFLDSLAVTYGTPVGAKKFEKAFHVFGKRYIAVARAVSSGVGKATPQDLAKRYLRYQKSTLEYTPYLWMGFWLNNWYAEQAKKMLNSKNITDGAAIAAVLSPAKRTSILALMDTLQKIKKQGKALSAALGKQILKKYIWMSCLDIHNNPWTEADLRAMYESIKPQTLPVSYKTVISKNKFSAKNKAFLDAMRRMVYVKDMRDEYRRRAVFAALPLFDAMAKQFGVDRVYLAYCTEEEIINALTKKQALPNSAEVKRRQAGFLIYRQAGRIIVTSDSDKIKQYVDANFEQVVAAAELRGNVASRGAARGPVVIVRGIADLEKVKGGEILVAVTTHPDFVPAMQRAAAFVTEEGGLTSHAAIVAREMKKPCVVGVKGVIAALKDGDLVEVDAEKGIVRKI